MEGNKRKKDQNTANTLFSYFKKKSHSINNTEDCDEVSILIKLHFVF